MSALLVTLRRAPVTCVGVELDQSEAGGRNARQEVNPAVSTGPVRGGGSPAEQC